jgi:hypothetical protein
MTKDPDGTPTAPKGMPPTRRTSTPGRSAPHPAASPFDVDDEAPGRPAPDPEIEQALVGQSMRVYPQRYHEATKSDVNAASTRIIGSAIALWIAVSVLAALVD